MFLSSVNVYRNRYYKTKPFVKLEGFLPNCVYKQPKQYTTYSYIYIYTYIVKHQYGRGGGIVWVISPWYRCHSLIQILVCFSSVSIRIGISVAINLNLLRDIPMNIAIQNRMSIASRISIAIRIGTDSSISVIIGMSNRM